MSSSVNTTVTITVAGQIFTWGCTGCASPDDEVRVVVERTDYTSPTETGVVSRPVSVSVFAERKVEINADNAHQFAGRKVRSASGDVGVVVGVLPEAYNGDEYLPSVLLGVEFNEWSMEGLLRDKRVPVTYFTHDASLLARDYEFGWFTNFGVYTLLD